MTNPLKHAIQWNLYDNTELILLKMHIFQHLTGTVFKKIMVILPIVREHLSWETTGFIGRFIQVSLKFEYDKTNLQQTTILFKRLWLD